MSTETIPQHYPETWDTSWASALQTADSRLKMGVTPDMVGGDRKWYNIGGTVAWKEVTGRYEETTYVAYETGKSWITPYKHDAPILLDEHDDAYLDSIVVPSSRIIQDQTAAYNRLCDAYARDAIQGTRTTGQAGDTTETFPSANVIAVGYGGGGDVGLTWGKIVEATRIMDTLRVPLAMRRFAIGAYEKADLMSIAQATDRDYANTNLIAGGTIHGTEWAGFTWHQYEDLEFDPSDADARQCLAWYEPDIILAESGVQTHMDILPSRSHALQIRPVGRLASGRVNNSSLIVKCKEP